MTYFGHSGNNSGSKEEPLRDHLIRVAERAKEYATVFGAHDEAYLAGMLHDLGKYSTLFLERLKGKRKHLDHWSTGAWATLQKYQESAFAAALAIQGHHIGLQEGGGGEDAFDRMDLKKIAQRHPLGLTLTEASYQYALDIFNADALSLPNAPVRSHYRPSRSAFRVASMLDMRMLFSALVDADFIETEAWFHGDSNGVPHYRQKPPPLNATTAYEHLMRYIEGTVKAKSSSATHVNAIRNTLLRDCLTKADAPSGLFTLTAPTGAGKTLAMIAFALKHACHNPRIRRIIMVIPYLSIIEQTADKYREIFEPVFGPLYVIEHHSLAGFPTDDNGSDKEDSENDAALNARLLAENWDAPIIVTTSVQCLESLFANRPRACRKLHRMADSVILFDEVQTLPTRLAVPTLAALSHLSSRYGSSIVFATATQPAFTGLHDKVKEFTGPGWMPTEIVSDTSLLFSKAIRTKISWPVGPPLRWDEIARELSGESNSQSLCIVNTKKHATGLASLLKEMGTDGLFHLSTSMCPAHRRAKLKEIRKRLETGQPCRLISTQCVEAGVDVDFPVVYRAFGPLDSVAQAAGRCNRGGKIPGLAPVRIFVPDDNHRYPMGAYAQAASVAEALLGSQEKLDIHDPETFKRYYTALYEITGNTDISNTFRIALDAWHFPEIAKEYRLIPGIGVNVLVPYERPAYEKLLNNVQSMLYITAEWTREARDHTVCVCCGKNDSTYRYLTPIKTIKGGESDEWFFCEYYDKDLLGLHVESAGHGLYM